MVGSAITATDSLIAQLNTDPCWLLNSFSSSLVVNRQQPTVFEVHYHHRMDIFFVHHCNALWVIYSSGVTIVVDSITQPSRVDLTKFTSAV